MHTHPDVAMLLAAEFRDRLTAEAETARLRTAARHARRARRGRHRSTLTRSTR